MKKSGNRLIATGSRSTTGGGRAARPCVGAEATNTCVQFVPANGRRRYIPPDAAAAPAAGQEKGRKAGNPADRPQLIDTFRRRQSRPSAHVLDQDQRR